MEGEWLDTFLVIDYTPHFVITGGGRICMLMPLLFAGIVLNVLWLLEQGERNDHHSTQYWWKIPFQIWSIDIMS